MQFQQQYCLTKAFEDEWIKEEKYIQIISVSLQIVTMDCLLFADTESFHLNAVHAFNSCEKCKRLEIYDVLSVKC